MIIREEEISLRTLKKIARSTSEESNSEAGVRKDGEVLCCGSCCRGALTGTKNEYREKKRPNHRVNREGT